VWAIFFSNESCLLKYLFHQLNAEQKKGETKMPPDDKKEPIENLKDKLQPTSGIKDPRKKKKAMPLKAHFSTWHHLYRYGKERSRFNSIKKGVKT